MSQLTDRVAAAAHIAPDTATQAIGFILAFMREEGDDQAVGEMIDKTPGAQDSIAAAGDPSFGGGGIMALGGKLMGLGLDMGQMRTIAVEMVAEAKAAVGEETVDRAISSVPGLAQFV